ncbi:tRNA(Ile2) 2-agmatinylcytidine synthetase [Desulfotomaculum arcticum]|uniref:tRNA(Ile2) 2-agmatinylcytidine synthetase n=1 Tax=Desulfotruncus arcticus DSM 17038 TaxID=1121424 RepID=A0A1I2X9J1_9FIRM|nr:hypothetical protein [Desulfotruncus arcticus]SFH10200.1 tRNA(Ile2) 2-agmatinylcytidine synthetase [Desulfotomaculum arcticum] [Desulfotruncus arcticus DSM 17038]
MKIYVGIDDTDNIDQGATGASANQVIKIVEENHWGSCQGLTRHQLLLHPDIAYTSHNSSMCFIAEIEAACLEPLIEEAGQFLEQHSAPGSDPGLCVVVEEQLRDTESLIAYGYETKIRIMTKEEAYALAGKLGVHLSEHGGTGLGVIGALAGVGLRMTNNDGRFQGKLQLKAPGAIINVAEIISSSPVERVQSVDGYVLREDEEVRLGNKLKTVLLDGKRILPVYRREDGLAWETCTNSHLEHY